MRTPSPIHSPKWRPRALQVTTSPPPTLPPDESTTVSSRSDAHIEIQATKAPADGIMTGDARAASPTSHLSRLSLQPEIERVSQSLFELDDVLLPSIPAVCEEPASMEESKATTAATHKPQDEVIVSRPAPTPAAGVGPDNAVLQMLGAAFLLMAQPPTSAPATPCPPSIAMPRVAVPPNTVCPKSLLAPPAAASEAHAVGNDGDDDPPAGHKKPNSIEPKAYSTASSSTISDHHAPMDVDHDGLGYHDEHQHGRLEHEYEHHGHGHARPRAHAQADLGDGKGDAVHYNKRRALVEGSDGDETSHSYAPHTHLPTEARRPLHQPSYRPHASANSGPRRQASVSPSVFEPEYDDERDAEYEQEFEKVWDEPESEWEERDEDVDSDIPMAVSPPPKPVPEVIVLADSDDLASDSGYEPSFGGIDNGPAQDAARRLGRKACRALLNHRHKPSIYRLLRGGKIDNEAYNPKAKTAKGRKDRHRRVGDTKQYSDVLEYLKIDKEREADVRTFDNWAREYLLRGQGASLIMEMAFHPRRAWARARARQQEGGQELGWEGERSASASASASAVPRRGRGAKRGPEIIGASTHLSDGSVSASPAGRWRFRERGESVRQESNVGRLNRKRRAPPAPNNDDNDYEDKKRLRSSKTPRRERRDFPQPSPAARAALASSTP